MTVPNVPGRISVLEGVGSCAKAAWGTMSSPARQASEKVKSRLPTSSLLSESGWPGGRLLSIDVQVAN